MDRLIIKNVTQTKVFGVEKAVVFDVLNLNGEKTNLPSFFITKGFKLSGYENSIDFMVEAYQSPVQIAGKLTINNKEKSGIFILEKTSAPNYECVIVLSSTDCSNIICSFTECSNLFWASTGLPPKKKLYSPKELNSLLNKNGKDTSSKWEPTDIKELEKYEEKQILNGIEK